MARKKDSNGEDNGGKAQVIQLGTRTTLRDRRLIGDAKVNEHTEKGLCGARTHKNGVFTGNLCKRPAGYRTDHPGYGLCVYHAGQTPAGKKSAATIAAKEAVEDVRKQMVVYGEKVDISPEQALLEEVQRCVGVVRWIEAKIGNWSDVAVDPETGMLPLMRDVYARNNTVITDTEHAAWLKVYQFERQHLARTAKMCIDAGISERIVKLAEQQGDLIFRVLRECLSRLGLADNPQLPLLVPVVIRELTG